MFDKMQVFYLFKQFIGGFVCFSTETKLLVLAESYVC